MVFKHFNEKDFFNIIVFCKIVLKYVVRAFWTFFFYVFQYFLQTMTIVEVGVNEVNLFLFFFLCIKFFHLVCRKIKIASESQQRLLTNTLLKNLCQSKINKNRCFSLTTNPYIFRFHIKVNDVEVVKNLHFFNQALPVVLFQIPNFHEGLNFSHCKNNSIIIDK